MSNARPSVRSVTFTPAVRPELRIAADDILPAQNNGSQVLDARDQPVYAGDVWRGSRGGHIPGALLTPAKSLVNADGTWKSLPELSDTVSSMGIDLEGPAIAYCNGGVTATAVLFALDRLGHKQIVNYDGSWNEWGERMDLPVEGSKQQAVSSK